MIVFDVHVLERQVKDRIRDETFVNRFLQVLTDDHEATDTHGDRLSSESIQEAYNTDSYEVQLVNNSMFLIDRYSLGTSLLSLQSIF